METILLWVRVLINHFWTKSSGFENKHIFIAVLTEDGKVYSFGLGDSGQLGHGDRASQCTPKLIEDFVNKGVTIQKIASGYDHAIAISGVFFFFFLFFSLNNYSEPK